MNTIKRIRLYFELREKRKRELRRKQALLNIRYTFMLLGHDISKMSDQEIIDMITEFGKAVKASLIPAKEWAENCRQVFKGFQKSYN